MLMQFRRADRKMTEREECVELCKCRTWGLQIQTELKEWKYSFKIMSLVNELNFEQCAAVTVIDIICYTMWKKVKMPTMFKFLTTINAFNAYK